MPTSSHKRHTVVTPEFHDGQFTWQLQRFPPRKNDPLQAWDSADELLIQAAAEMQSPVMVLNDSFGALAIALAARGFSGITISDSTVSLRALQHNCKLNDTAALLPAPVTSVWPDNAATIVLKIPKSMRLLEAQLQWCIEHNLGGCKVIAAAKSKLFTPSVRALFDNYCIDVDVSLIQKKSRVLRATLRQSPPQSAPTLWNDWLLPVTSDVSLKINNAPGVFAQQQLDIGARLLLDHLPENAVTKAIDLGCGNGVLGLSYSQMFANSEVVFCDESYLAIESITRSIKDNASALGQSDRLSARVDDCLSDYLKDEGIESADLVLCNPPFHQEHAIT